MYYVKNTHSIISKFTNNSFHYSKVSNLINNLYCALMQRVFQKSVLTRRQMRKYRQIVHPSSYACAQPLIYLYIHRDESNRDDAHYARIVNEKPFFLLFSNCSRRIFKTLRAGRILTHIHTHTPFSNAKYGIFSFTRFTLQFDASITCVTPF